jgi:hypothetical protein
VLAGDGLPESGVLLPESFLHGGRGAGLDEFLLLLAEESNGGLLLEGLEVGAVAELVVGLRLAVIRGEEDAVFPLFLPVLFLC